MPKLTFPKRHKHADVRSREYLTAAEVTRLRKAARSVGRHGHRNDTMILLAYRHGLRVSELIALRWDQVDLDQGFPGETCGIVSSGDDRDGVFRIHAEKIVKKLRIEYTTSSRTARVRLEAGLHFEKMCAGKKLSPHIMGIPSN